VNNLKVTAYLSTPIGVYDNWSPSLEGLLTYRLLEENNLLSPNPTAEQVAKVQDFLVDELPLKQNTIMNDKYFCVTSPCYVVQGEVTDRYRKRWDNHENSLNWGKRKPKILTGEGAEKSYDLPLYTRLTNSISWFVVGDKTRINALLSPVTHIQKKRSYGNGEIKQWQIEIAYDDYHLWRDDELMRPMPVRLISQKIDNPQLIWGWKSPAWLATNKELCYMPKDNVIYA
jgi:CRISPR type IV-associated protein Csf3